MFAGRHRASRFCVVASWGCVGTALAFGCGARASAGPAEDELTPDTATGGGGTANPAGTGGGAGLLNSTGGSSMGGTSSSAGAGGRSPFNFETHELPPCDPGFRPSDANGRNCTYRFNDLCYEDETSVCACACPRQGNSSCVLSGFLGDPNQPLQVRCNAN